MHLLSFNNVTFTSLGVTSPKFDDPTSPGPDIQLDIVPRIGANPLFGGALTGGQTLTVDFTVNTGQNVETTKLKVLAALALSDPHEKLLVAELADGTDIETDARVARTSHPDINTLSVDFVLMGPWRAQTTTNMKTLAGDVTNGNFANSNSGYDDMLPVITSYWPASTQRSSSTATFGWKHRLGTGLTITNNGTEPLINQPYQIGPIDHKSIVTAGRGLSSGDDLRVFCEGKELRRNIIGPNTLATLIWVILPTVAPGQAITLDILTNNASAGSPPTLTFSSNPALPGMDISGTSFSPSSGLPSIVNRTGAGWETNQWAGATIIHITAGNKIDSVRKIVSNTATAITVDAVFATTPGTSDTMTVTKSGFSGTGGQTNSATTTTITTSASNWRPNEWVGATIAHVRFTSGVITRRTVVSNTANSVTFTGSISPAPDVNDWINIYQQNGARVWDVRQPPKTTSYPGLWQANKIQAPPTQINFDAPGSWYRFVYRQSNDAFSQPRYDSFLVGAGDYDHVPIMNIQRARRGKAGSQKEVGVADAIGVSTPFPIKGTYFGYTIRNAKKAGSGTPGEGMAEARFMTQEAGGELWSTFLSDVAVNNSTATVTPAWYDLTGSGSPNRMAMTLIPNGSDEIPQQDNNTAQLRSTGDYVALAVNPTAAITESVDWFTSPPSTVAVYDYNLIMRTGGAGPTPPYHQVVIGGTDHRIFITGTDERIVVDCEKHTAILQTAAGAFVRSIPWAVQAQYVTTDPVDGTTRTLVANRWLPIPSNTVDNTAIYFSDPSGAGWGNINIGVTGRKGYRS